MSVPGLEYDPVTPAAFVREKRLLLFVYIPTFLLVCLTAIMVLGEPAAGVFDLAFSVGANFWAFAWVRIDSRQKGYKLHRLFPYAIIIFGFFALIYYLFRSRGLSSGFVALGFLVLYIVATLLVTGLVFLIIALTLLVVGILPSTS